MSAAAPVSTTYAEAYPVHVDARLDEPLNRWLWLVKWFLAIPHFVLLAVLSVGAILAGVAAFFAILFTGRYPRALFDYNLGVMRWWWRVEYYAFGIAGTDRYPPFTLGPASDYPATLNVEYPERLSRWKPLVKWLLAFPHWFVLAAFSGGWGAAQWGGVGVGAPGAIFALTLVALMILLVTQRYPANLHALVLGMIRWTTRVEAYMFLMTDRYPPFRLED